MTDTRRPSRGSVTGGIAEDRSAGSSGVQSVDRALQILEVLAEDSDGYRLSDLSVRVGLPTSTTHRLLNALAERRFVRFEPGEASWSVGIQAFAVGSAFPLRRHLGVLAMPVLRKLRDDTGETANLGVVDRDEVVVLAQVESREIIRAISPIGGRAPMAADALGKAIMATWSQAIVDALVARYGLSRHTESSITRAGTLRRELEAIRTVGYAIDRGEFVPDLRCVAAAVQDHKDEAVAAISISGFVSRMPEERLAELGERIASAAEQLTVAIGGRPPGERASLR